MPGDQDVEPPGELLFSLHDGTPPARTELPFAVTTLLTRARGEPALGHELSTEIATAHTIDALVSFVTLSGFRCLQAALEAHAQAGRQLRLLTTTYTGATEADAVDAIAVLPGLRSASHSMRGERACTPKPGSSVAPMASIPAMSVPRPSRGLRSSAGMSGW